MTVKMKVAGMLATGALAPMMLGVGTAHAGNLLNVWSQSTGALITVGWTGGSGASYCTYVYFPANSSVGAPVPTFQDANGSGLVTGLRVVPGSKWTVSIDCANGDYGIDDVVM